MESAWLVLLAMLLGLAVGVAFSTAVVLALRSGDRAMALVNQEVPDGIEETLLVLPSAGMVIDPSNTVVTHSPSAVALGLVRDRQLVHPSLVTLVDDARRSEDSLEQELALSRGPFGDESLLVTARAARLGVRYVLLLVDDDTEAHRLEDVRRDFMANISHELKTPIGAIGLLSEALVSAADDREQVERFASRMMTEAVRLSNITAEIIELSRLQAGNAIASPEIVDLDHVIASAIEQSAVVADARRIEVAKGGTKKVKVLGDQALLTVAVHNLISNAIQYSPDGSRVGVGVRLADELAEIAVTDQGVGIDEADLGRVFERFYRVDPARSRNTGGTGLGLSIVKHVVQNHGGEVKVWSRRGRGSTFTIRIPEASESRSAALGLERE
ncbi:cell wall metabolism sensor histidine kinase WalK [Herbiconiux sp. L3-i23]|uniref:sensor histidine kinase n=1 Tax=Herbiconiux sp. L3-i23 TaxID=2905871 RepID=UPI00206765F2|nr:ATP-binding protein [Herbiconiux sp. L3-i23]BDI23743.1 two-component sensor histidine kinase [Herbiconiux sp. L3-i23]